MKKRENSTDMTLFGIDRLLQTAPSWKKKRLALVTNDAATTSTGEKSRKAITDNGFNLVKLYAPEHGLSAQGADGAAQANGTDPLTGLPVISLYGEKMRPAAEDLTDIDVILFDIPDSGCRFYTYLWTMTHVMEACADHHIPFIVLDRPNPLSGDLEKAEGPFLDEVHCASFIGRWTIPVRHCCTLGELAVYFAATRVHGLQPEIIRLQNWNRAEPVAKAGWYFVPTSPAIRDIHTVALYPATCFLEGVNINEGRGSGNDFTVCGAPWINAEKLAAAFMELQLPGIRVQPFRYIPEWGLYESEVCNGLQFIITNESDYCPVKTGLLLLQLLKKNYPVLLKERLYPTAANPPGQGHLDRLTGVKDAFTKIESGELVAAAADIKGWKETISPYLLY